MENPIVAPAETEGGIYWTLISVTTPINSSSNNLVEIFAVLIIWESANLATLVDKPATSTKSFKFSPCVGSKWPTTDLPFHSNTTFSYNFNVVSSLLTSLPVKRFTWALTPLPPVPSLLNDIFALVV